MDLKLDQRKDKRLRCEAVIWHDNLLPEIHYNAKMYNLSKAGVYFESDQIIYPGEDICIGLKDPASPVNDTKDRFRVEIRWRKDLQNTSFRFGYGAKLINPIDTLVNSLDRTELRRQSTHSNVLKHKEDPRKHRENLFAKQFFLHLKVKTIRV